MKHRVIEHYELDRKLGTGGSGVVFLANDTQLQRPVVLKLLQRGTLTPEQMRTTYLREARLASAIDHPNVCAIYDVGEIDDEAYIVMQYVPGKPLDRLVASGPATVELVLSVGIQIADGLAAAHSLGIFHRDLKPANLILTDGGLLKILDFGLARRIRVEEADFDPAIHAQRQPAISGTYTARGGTIAYMAPEQFVTGQSSVQSDIFALGVVLYELLTGRHPFHRPDTPDFQTVRAIQFSEPPSIRELAPEAPVELESAILHCLQKQPAERFNSAAELRESLRTILKTSQLDSLVVPSASLSVQTNLEFRTPDEEKRSTGLLSMLAERFRESGGNQSHNTIVVLPFVNMGPADAASLYGHALADAISARLARMQSLVVRPSSTLMNVAATQLDPLSIGRKLSVEYVVAGSFLRSDKGFDLNWQMLHIPEQAVRAGGSINVESFDLVAVQNEIGTEIFSALSGGAARRANRKGHGTERDNAGPLDGEISEDYLQARALLSSFMFRTGSPEDLQRAQQLFMHVVERDPSYAPGWSGLGITHLQYLRHGLGGQMHLLEMRRALDKALALDPRFYGSKPLPGLYAAVTRREGKRPPRHRTPAADNGERLERSSHRGHDAAQRWAVRAGTAKSSALHFGLSPSDAPIIYNHRARVYQYQNQFELAGEEIQKGLTLEPRQPMLRITHAATSTCVTGRLKEAIAATGRGDRQKTIRCASCIPTIAMCYAMLGDREKASTFIVEQTIGRRRGRQRDGLSSRNLLRRGWRKQRGSALAAPRHLSWQ